MQNKLKFIGLIMAVAWLFASNCPGQQDQPRDTAAVKAQFNEIIARLDTGGDLLLVANIDGLVKTTINQLAALASMANTGGQDAPAYGEIIARLTVFMKQNGFYAVRGFGLSMVPRADGLNDIKTFLARDADAVSLPLWQGLVGGTPRQLASPAFLPADTALAMVSSADLKQLWKLIRSGVNAAAPPEGAAAFEQSLAMAAAVIGVGLDELIGSFGAEGFISLQLSRDATISIPTGFGADDAAISMPSPSLLICLAVNDNTLPDLIQAKLSALSGPGDAMPLLKEEVAGAMVQTLNLPLPLPVPLELTFAQKDGFFLLGTTRQAVTDAIRAAASGAGLIATPEFKEYFDGLPKENNGWVFLDRRLSETLGDVQSRLLTATQAGAGVDMGGLTKMFASAFQERGATVMVNMPAGVASLSVSSSGGRELALNSALAPIGMLAAIAIPSFMRARTTSQQNACINNLRIIESVKEYWAMEYGKTNGTVAAEADILEYLPGKHMRVCPNGGTYTLGAVGENAACSMPGHVMPW